jgi:hypothetical protein
LSWSECTKTNPPQYLNQGGDIENPEHVAGKAVGECIERGPVQTPGTVIASQLNKVLPANMERFINAQHLEDLVSAFVTGALNRYVFGSRGIFN